MAKNQKDWKKKVQYSAKKEDKRINKFFLITFLLLGLLLLRIAFTNTDIEKAVNVILDVLLILGTSAGVVAYIWEEKKRDPADIFWENEYKVVGITVFFEKSFKRGSAVVLRNDGMMATVASLLFEENTDRPSKGILCYLSWQQTLSLETDVEIIKYDLELDIAILRLKCKRIKSIEPVGIGSGYALKGGEKVYAIGDVMRKGNFFSEGVVGYPPHRNFCVGRMELYIQTYVVQLSGYTGGAVFNERGKFVGMITATQEGQYSSAIPAEEVLEYLQNG